MATQEPRAASEASLGAQRSGRTTGRQNPTARSPRLRAELWGGDTFDGHGNWLHDVYVAHAVEYEWMLFDHVSMGLRGLPALIYFDDSPIAAAGLGVTNRIYWTAAGDGIYAGPEIAAVVHVARFAGNSAHINLLSSFEIGYQFVGSPFRIAVKLEHLSNAGLGERNRGWNGIGILLGASLYARTGERPGVE